MKRVFPQLVCILLLLVAQHGALTHAVWHAHESQPAQHERHDNTPLSQSGESGLCDFDLAFGQVMGGVCAAAWHLVFSEFDAERIVHLSSTCVAAETPVARSRGPPLFS